MNRYNPPRFATHGDGRVRLLLDPRHYGREPDFMIDGRLFPRTAIYWRPRLQMWDAMVERGLRGIGHLTIMQFSQLRTPDLFDAISFCLCYGRGYPIGKTTRGEDEPELAMGAPLVAECRSPYCECAKGQCAEGKLDKRGEHGDACTNKPEGATHYLKPHSGVKYYRRESITYQSVYLDEPENFTLWLRWDDGKWKRTAPRPDAVPITF